MAGERVVIHAYQIIVWVSLTADETWRDTARCFPAILDTGHNHNFSIRDSQLIQWGGIRTDQLQKAGAIFVNRREVPLYRASLWIHRNRPGTTDLLPKPVCIPIPEGVSVFPSDSVGAPRLPLLGVRGLVCNGLRLVVEGKLISLSK